MKMLIVFAAMLASLSLSAATEPVQVRKLGTIDLFIVEASPIVFKGRPYLMEYIRYFRPDLHYRTNDTGHSYLRFRSLDDLKTFTPPFGEDLHLASAFAEGEKVYVTAVKGGFGGNPVVILESEDLVRWSEPRVVLAQPGYRVYNTTLCKADGKYVMAFEMDVPKEKVGVPYTMFFAASKDLKSWQEIDGASFGKTFYTGAPLLRYHDGWYYFFYLRIDKTSDPKCPEVYRQQVVRSRDLKTWEHSRRTVLDFDADDRLVHPKAQFTADERRQIAESLDINASDIDMTEYGGKLLISYSWGDQQGHEFLALAEADCTEREFCESFFPKGEDARSDNH